METIQKAVLIAHTLIALLIIVLVLSAARQRRGRRRGVRSRRIWYRIRGTWFK